MADHIHTIPVLDALREPKGCAFCVMHENLERTSIQFIMSPAYMEDDVRRETNKSGFCKRHLDAMYEAQNRLGLALMMHTHLAVLNKKMDDTVKNRLPAPLFKKDTGGPLAKMHDFLGRVDKACYVCNRVENTFARYIDTFFYLWGAGGTEARLIAEQKGYCLPHFLRLTEAAAGLGRSKRERFLSEFVSKQQKLMQELEADLEWFIFKFDHRNADEPWKNAKDALIRAIALLGGRA